MQTRSSRPAFRTYSYNTRRCTDDRDDAVSVRDMIKIADAMASDTPTMTGMLGAVAGFNLPVERHRHHEHHAVSTTYRTRRICILFVIDTHEKHISYSVFFYWSRQRRCHCSAALSVPQLACCSSARLSRRHRSLLCSASWWWCALSSSRCYRHGIRLLPCPTRRTPR